MCILRPSKISAKFMCNADSIQLLQEPTNIPEGQQWQIEHVSLPECARL